MSSTYLFSTKVSVVSQCSVPNDIYTYDCYNNRFLAGASGSDSGNSTSRQSHENGQVSTMFCRYERENDTKEEIPNVISNKLYTYELNLDVALLHSQNTQRHETGQNSSFKQDSFIAVIDKSMTIVPLKKHFIQPEHSKCYKDIPKWVLAGEVPFEDSAVDYTSDYPIYQKIDREAVVDLAANRHNRCNREIHDCLWCPCILYSMFLFCIPAMLLMHFSDTAFQNGEDSKARHYATCSTALYVLGLAISIVFYAAIVFLIIHFHNYQI